MKLLIFCFILILILISFHVFTKNYLNPYKLIFVFGRKGSGKSLLMSKLVDRYISRGWSVFVNDQSMIKNFVPNKKGGTPHYVDARKLYIYDFPDDTCIFIDEVSLLWDNRDFKTMDKSIVEWFRYQRKHKCRVYLFSQTFDIDKKLRDLADDMYLVNKVLRVFVIAKHIIRKPVVVHPSADAPARIDDDMIVDGPLLWLFGGLEVAFIPKWAKRYDTNATDLVER